MEEIGRKHPIHLDVHDRRDTPIIVYLTVCTKRRKRDPGESGNAWTVASSVAWRTVMAGWPLRCHAWPYSSILRASGVRRAASVTMGQVLEVIHGAQLDSARWCAYLAAPFLGYAIAQKRKLRSEVELRCGESSPREVGR